MKTNFWLVYINNKEIDGVFYDERFSADEVKKSLVDHDGYHPNIKVRKGK